MVNYQVELNSPNSHYIDVTLVYPGSLKLGQLIWLPDWIPGSYMIRDFSKNIVSIQAFEETSAIELCKIDKSSWSLPRDVQQLTIQYRVYAWDLSVRSAHFDDQHCFFNGTSLFLALQGKEQQTHQVNVLRPTFQHSLDWSVATAMKGVDLDKRGFGHYESENYAELIDHPFEIANLNTINFEVMGVDHQMVFSEAPKDIDYQRIANDVQKICQYECDLFGDPKPPFEHYYFMTYVLKNGFGGLEHRASTALQCSHADLPKIGDNQDEKSAEYQRYLALCSHEYFHSWNVKRIKPERFSDYALRNEVNTELLWFFEGITSYYDELVLVRCGVITLEQYLEMVAKNITRMLRGSGHKKQTITESSFDAWTKFYKQDENSVNSLVSYYVKGGLISFLLDFELRRISDDQISLDDLMRSMWNEFGKTQIGVPEKQIQLQAEKLVGQSMQEFFQRTLYSTEPLELKELFAKFGINYQLVAEHKQLEPGGFSEKLVERKAKNGLGIITKKHELGSEVINVFEDSSAAKMGLSNRDIIIAINDYRVTFDELDKTIANFQPGEQVEIVFFRRDKLHQRKCLLQAANETVCFLSLDRENLNSAIKDWLHLS